MLRFENRGPARAHAASLGCHCAWSVFTPGFFVGRPDELRAAGCPAPDGPGWGAVERLSLEPSKGWFPVPVDRPRSGAPGFRAMRWEPYHCGACGAVRYWIERAPNGWELWRQGDRRPLGVFEEPDSAVDAYAQRDDACPH